MLCTQPLEWLLASGDNDEPALVLQQEVANGEPDAC